MIEHQIGDVFLGYSGRMYIVSGINDCNGTLDGWCMHWEDLANVRPLNYGSLDCGRGSTHPKDIYG